MNAKDYFSSPRVYFRMTARLYLESLYEILTASAAGETAVHGTSCPWPDMPDSLHTQPCCTSHSCLQKSKKTNQVTLTISFYTPHYQHQLKTGKKNLMKVCKREGNAEEESVRQCRGQLCCDTNHNNVCSSDWTVSVKHHTSAHF